MLPFMARRTLQIKDIKMGQLFRIMQVDPKCNLKCPHWRQTVGGLMTEEEKGNVKVGRKG